jgi:hypothetical protein
MEFQPNMAMPFSSCAYFSFGDMPNGFLALQVGNWDKVRSSTGPDDVIQ